MAKKLPDIETPDYFLTHSNKESNSKKINNINTLNEFLAINSSNSNTATYKQMINSMISQLENKMVDGETFSQMISLFKKMTSNEDKFEFIKYFRNSFEAWKIKNLEWPEIAQQEKEKKNKDDENEGDENTNNLVYKRSL